MLATEGSLTNLSHQRLVSGFFSLMAVSALLYSSAHFVNQWTAAPALRIDLNRWSWMTQLSVGVEPSSPEDSRAIAPVAVGPVPFLKMESPKSEPRLEVKSSTGASQLSKAKSAARRLLTRTGLRRKSSKLKDQILATASAPVDTAPVQIVTPVAVASDQTSSDAAPSHELKKLQQIHQTLRMRFRVAVDQNFDAPEVEVALGHLPKLDIQKIDTQGQDGVVAAATDFVKPAPLSAGMSKPVRTFKSHSKMQSFDVAAELSESVSLKEAPLTDPEPKVKEAAQKVEELMQAKLAWLGVPASNPLVQSQTLAIKSDYPISSFKKADSGLTSQKSVPAGNISGTQVAMNTQNQARKEVPENEYSVLSEVETAVSSQTQFREAFNLGQPVGGVQVEVVTAEANGLGWRSYQTEGYWPTVSRAGEKVLPLLSQNSAEFLALAAGAQLQKEAGVVFGKVPHGWSVSFSGRAERGVLLNLDNQPVSLASVEGDRYFAFVNAAPGAQLLQLQGHSPQESGVLAIPVMAGRATFIDLSTLSLRKIVGHVYHAEQNELSPAGGVRVRLSGVLGQDVLTSGDGAFEIPHAVTLGDYPVYLETDDSEGFTHRYSVKPESFEKVTLYRLGAKQVQSWVGQLEGGVSPESGLLVVAVPPSVLTQFGAQPLLPQVNPLMERPTLVPETYTLAQDGQLEVQAPIRSDSPRFISVQLPEGALAAELVNAKKKVVWSELFVAQPRIINIISP